VRANLLAAVAPGVEGHVAVNVAGGQQTTVNELAREILVVTGSDIEPEHQAERPGDVRHSEADLTRAQALLGYVPETDLTEGLVQCLSHYQAVLAGGPQ
jgi:nucleoside-diphosphate-sugar epimerase